MASIDAVHYYIVVEQAYVTSAVTLQQSEIVYFIY